MAARFKMAQLACRHFCSGKSLQRLYTSADLIALAPFNSGHILLHLIPPPPPALDNTTKNTASLL